jgi:hypothetical protein
VPHCAWGTSRGGNARRRRLAAGGWRLAAGGWRLAAGGWRLAAGGWRQTLISTFLGIGTAMLRVGIGAIAGALRPVTNSLIFTA